VSPKTYIVKTNLVRWLKRYSGLLAVLWVLSLLYLFLPLGVGLQLGGDEGYELMKALLFRKGYALYTQIWNDQPPLFTVLLSCSFGTFGTTALVARSLAAAFGFLLFVSFYTMLRKRSGGWAALAASFLLLASPGVLLLSAAAMLEVPAVAMALASGLLVFMWRERRQLKWLITSGAVMGIALGIKLTAVVVAPAILLEILLQYRVGADRTRLRLTFIDMGRWGAAAVGALLIIYFLWARGSYHTSLRSHFSSQYVPGLSLPTDFRFQPALFLDHAECLFAAVVALGFAIRKKSLGSLAFPIALLITALGIHSVHTPWWNYYYLHFAVPLAWLAGVGLTELLQIILPAFSSARFQLRSLSPLKLAALSILAAFAVVVAEARLESSIKSMRNSPKVADSQIIAHMKQFAGRTHWAYAQPVIYPFHAGLLVPPELAVVMLKRFWSGQITTEQIVDTCRRYKPEQILLYTARSSGPWERFLKENYSPAYHDQELTLYISNSILP
jgi:4-amino-4-deoxy-L-arabinose transferase-like glycosyltransferase